MSVSSIKHALLRIKDAHESSPIAVFSVDSLDEVDAVFAATIRTQQIIATNPPNYIGTFHGGMPITQVSEAIRKGALNK